MPNNGKQCHWRETVVDGSSRKEEQELTGKVAAVHKLTLLCSKDAIKKEDFIGMRQKLRVRGGRQVWEECSEKKR